MKHHFYELYDNENCDNRTTEIYVSDSSEPPSRMDASVRRLCMINWSRKISLGELPTWTNPLGRVYHALRWEVEMTCEEGTLDFVTWFDGKRIGGHNVNVAFD